MLHEGHVEIIDAGADSDADIGGGEVLRSVFRTQAGILESFPRDRQKQPDTAAAPCDGYRFGTGFPRNMFHFGYNLGVIFRGIPKTEWSNTIVTCQQTLPASLQVRAERCAHAHSGDDHSVHSFAFSLRYPARLSIAKRRRAILLRL